MSQQPAEEWSEMSQQQRDEIRARLIAACDTEASAATLRQHLAHASRPSARVCEAMRHSGL